MSGKILDFMTSVKVDESTINIAKSLMESYPLKDLHQQIVDMVTRYMSPSQLEQLHKLFQEVMQEGAEPKEEEKQQLPAQVNPADLALLKEISTIIDDASELIGPEQIFVAGLLLGRTHGEYTLNQAIQLMVKVNKIADQEEKERTLVRILKTNDPQDYFEEHKNQGQQQIVDSDEEDMADHEKVLMKELEQLDPNVNETMGLESECKLMNDDNFEEDHFKKLYFEQKELNEILKENLEKTKKSLSDQDEELAKKLEKELNEEEKKKPEPRKVQAAPMEYCQICKDNFMDNRYLEEELHTLTSCKHIFHTKCILYYVGLQKNNQKSNILIIECPFKACKEPIAKAELEQLVNRSPVVQKRKKNAKFINCPTDDCPYMFQVENYQLSSFSHPTKFDCPCCEMDFCLICRKEYHSGRKCNEVIQPVEEKKQCPRCKYWVIRKKLQTVMNCRCGKKFCFFCGKINCTFKNVYCPANMKNYGNGFGDLQNMKDARWING